MPPMSMSSDTAESDSDSDAANEFFKNGFKSNVPIPIEHKAFLKCTEIMNRAGFENKNAAQTAAAAKIMEEAKKVADKDPERRQKRKDGTKSQYEFSSKKSKRRHRENGASAQSKGKSSMPICVRRKQ